MKITSGSPVNNKSAVKKKSGTQNAGGTGFSSLLGGVSDSEETGAAQGGASVGATSSIDGILSLQEVPDSLAEKKKAVKQGNMTLDALEDLRISMLLGNVAPAQLEKIKQRMEMQKGNVSDTELSSLMKEIEVRAAVELAKLGRI